MKNIFFLAIFLWTASLFAQTEGTVHYTESVKLEIELAEGQEHLRDMIPTTSDFTKVLYFSKDQSMYRDAEGSSGTKEFNQESDGNEMQVKIVSGSADNRLYKDFAADQVIDQRDFLGKKFLIKGTTTAPKLDWKITGEQAKILAYTCQKATYTTDDDQEITAWFTPQIPVSNGPDVYGQLPGLILKLEMDGGKRTTTATKIELGKVAADKFEVPSKGKKVSRDQFKKIRAEKMKEMGSTNGRTVIKMQIDDRG